jgi:hypothetical protein
MFAFGVKRTTDLPPPVGKRDPQTVRVDLLSAEVEGRLAVAQHWILDL